ncbi:DUF6364 family protein [Jannaschia formosa]|uniref:DUF6364 family protein n=1 Tax=Jannaschia formosa TaxID=2259592 RepID=UPI000E1B6F35|nr:DUF6364 family protein [Jannaschia formosa]TFL16624.1 hypothetical protein DR046_18760 [Jannaschia formosa]
MKRNTTINLDQELIARTRAYAAAHGTTMTKLIQSHLEALTREEAVGARDALLLWSEGRISPEEACRRIGLRDGAALLVHAAARDVPMPIPPRHEIEAQAEEFVALWRATA